MTEPEPPTSGPDNSAAPLRRTDCEVDPYFQAARLIQMQNFPESQNPLTLALIQGARARTHEDMVQAARLIRVLESQATGCEADRCRLAAEVLIERGQA